MAQVEGRPDVKRGASPTRVPARVPRRSRTDQQLNEAGGRARVRSVEREMTRASSPSKEPKKKKRVSKSPEPRGRKREIVYSQTAANLLENIGDDAFHDYQKEQNAQYVTAVENNSHAEMLRRLVQQKQNFKQTGSRVEDIMRSCAEDELRVLTMETKDWLCNALGKDFQDDVRDTDGIDPIDTFFSALQTGVHLCHLVQQLTKDQSILKACKCNEAAVEGTFVARDNLANFLKAAKALGVPEISLFEVDDLVNIRNRKRIVSCLLQLAKLIGRMGRIAPPLIVQYEMEIDDMEKHGDAHQCEDVWPSKSEPLDFEIMSAVKRNNIDVGIKHIKNRKQLYQITTKTYEGEINVSVAAIRSLRGILMVRVGGGWETFISYCQRRKNMSVTGSKNLKVELNKDVFDEKLGKYSKQGQVKDLEEKYSKVVVGITKEEEEMQRRGRASSPTRAVDASRRTASPDRVGGKRSSSPDRTKPIAVAPERLVKRAGKDRKQDFKDIDTSPYWQIMFDEYGKAYYWNMLTNEASRERPANCPSDLIF